MDITANKMASGGKEENSPQEASSNLRQYYSWVFGCLWALRGGPKTEKVGILENGT